MNCKRCGACCKYHWLVSVSLEDSEKIPKNLTCIMFGSTYMKKNNKGYCIACNQKTRSCKIYKNRPEVCRLFPPGGKDCKKVRN